MGEVEADSTRRVLIIRSRIVTYGNAADTSITEQIREEIETMWNEPAGEVLVDKVIFSVQFEISASLQPALTELDVLQNTDPSLNFFRIEEYARGNISFVDGLGCNTGYFKLENLYRGSTTAAHEYGHTLGLDHPARLDIRGEGVPGIMYPRGTLVDPPYQYDPSKPAGVTGGTMHPMYRKVKATDIADLRLHKLRFRNGLAVLGDFSNVYHYNHSDENEGTAMKSTIFG